MRKNEKGFYRGQPIAIPGGSSKQTPPSVERPIEVYVIELNQGSDVVAGALQMVFDRFFHGDIRIRPRVHHLVSGVGGSLAIAVRELTEGELNRLFLCEMGVFVERGRGWKKLSLPPR